MAKQSELTTTLRALVMLSCLVAMPAVAVSGRSLPEMVKSLVAQGDCSPQPDADKGLPQGVAWNVTPPAPHEEIASDASNDGDSQVDQRAVGGFSPRRPAVASNPLVADPRSETIASPSWSATPDPSGERPGVVAAVASGVSTEGRTVLASHNEPLVAPVRRPPQTLAAQAPGRPAAAPRDPFAQAEQRLRQLGATYYLLESWGQQEQLYRFYCRVAVAGSPDYTRYFEATASEPLAAMARVLAQVEAWRAGR